MIEIPKTEGDTNRQHKCTCLLAIWETCSSFWESGVWTLLRDCRVLVVLWTKLSNVITKSLVQDSRSLNRTKPQTFSLLRKDCRQFIVSKSNKLNFQDPPHTHCNILLTTAQATHDYLFVSLVPRCLSCKVLEKPIFWKLLDSKLLSEEFVVNIFVCKLSEIY